MRAAKMPRPADRKSPVAPFAIARICLFVLGYFLAPSVFAASADELFARGVAEFKAGNYAKALRYFHEAQIGGLDRPALFYNLGVSYYKLGRYAEAEQAFLAAARDSRWAPLAYYNMGLAAYQRGERTVASAHFRRAWRDAEDNKLRALALTALERIDRAAAARPQAELALRMGYDSNVTLTRDSETLRTAQEPDAYTELSAFATGRWGNGSDGIRWDAGLYGLSYRNLDDFNFTQALVGADKLGTIGAWRTGLGGRWKYRWLSGRGFQRVASLRLHGRREWPDESDLRLSLEVSRVDAVDSRFEPLAGSRVALDLSTARRAGDGRLRWGISVTSDQREDFTDETRFFSFSPTRYTAWLDGSWRFAESWRVEPVIRYGQSRYADPDRHSGLIERRADERAAFTLRLKRRLNVDWRLVGEYTYIDNNSNFREFSYVRSLVNVGVARSF